MGSLFGTDQIDTNDAVTGGAPGAIDADRAALAEAVRFFGSAPGLQPCTER